MPSASSSAPALKVIEISKPEDDGDTVKAEDEEDAGDVKNGSNDEESQTNNDQSNGSNETIVDEVERGQGKGIFSCCMVDVPCNYRLISRLTVCVKIIEIVLGLVILALAGVVALDRMETVGSAHAKGMGTYSTFIVCVFSSLMIAFVLLTFQVAMDRKVKRHKRVNYWMKGLDFTSSILLIIGFILEFYILIKWQVDWTNSFGQDLPQLGEMITIAIFLSADITLYLFVLCTTFPKK